MIRRFLVPGAIAAVLISAGSGLFASSASVEKASEVRGRVPVAPAKETGPSPCPSATAVDDDSSLTESEVLARAASDAEKLGLPLVKTLAAGHAIVVGATREETQERLSASEGIPFVAIAPAYSLHGDTNKRSIVAFSNRLLIKFSDSASEAEKISFYRANGLTLLKEYGTGNVFVCSTHEPNAGMVDFARDLSAANPRINGAAAELILTGESTANSDSIEIEDPLFPYQWYLFNSVVNTNNGLGTPDVDLDAPRAWMNNLRNAQDAPGATGNGIFGDPSISVGIFDSGTEISHEDLAENIDPAVGFSSIGGQPINSGGGLLAAHGTVMAGLVAAAKNTNGIVGVAPGVKIYSLKIFANDLSTTSVSISQAVDATVSAGVDINVHPYALPLNRDDGATVVIEDSLRQSFESGREGLGTSNFAASGNFHAQVEYPAQSKWCIAVGSDSADSKAADNIGSFNQPETSGIPRHNWGGVGIDFVMPSYVVSTQNFPIESSGIVSTDLSGSSGVSTPNPNLVGNEQGNYTLIGPLSQLRGVSFVDIDNATRYKGTSVSAALAGGVAALFLSDERYNQLPPFIDVGPDPNGPNGPDSLVTRHRRHDRAPLRGQAGSDANLLSAMKNYSDLPGGNDLRYIDQADEFFGFGQPNPARALALPGFDSDTSDNIAAGSNVTPDYFYRGLLLDPPVYEATFGMPGLAGDNNVEGAEDTLGMGWKPLPNARLQATLTQNGDPVTISPYLEGVSTLYFENGDTVNALPTEDGDPTFFYVWTDSVTTSPVGSETSTAQDNLVFNPRGLYHAGSRLILESPKIIAPSLSAPFVFDIQLAHELGVEDSASNSLQPPVNRTGTISESLDSIKLYVVPDAPPDGPRPQPFEIATITGDSTDHSKVRLTAPAVVNIATTGIVARPLWPGPPTNKYEPQVSDDQMVIRTYSYFVRALDPGTTFTLRLELNPGNSYLPSYSSVPGPPIAYTQLHNVRRDLKGFIFYSAKLSQIDPAYMEYLDLDVFEPSDGQFPTWSASTHDVMLSRLDFNGTDSYLVQADPEQIYLSNPGSMANASTRPNMRLMKTNNGETITGLRAHPIQEILAMTTTSSEGQFVYTITTDGVNQTRIIDPSLTVGARDPNWSINGSQLVYCSHDYVRIASLQDTGEWTIETVQDTARSTTFLEDFHSPIFDPESGIIYFTARRRDQAATDLSLKIYVTTRTGRAITYSTDPRATLVSGWDGIDIFDLDISRSGKRLIFSATASAPPTHDPDTDEPINAVPSSAAKLFTIENMDFVVNFNDAPIYNQIVLQSKDAGFPKVSARWPRISPNSQEIVWQAFNIPVDENTGNGNGRIVRQPIGFQENFAPPVNQPNPIPPPTTTPVGTPPDPDQAHTTLSGGYNFAPDAQGWEFRSGGNIYDNPTTSYSNVDSFPGEISPGVIAFVASSANAINKQGVVVATLNFTGLTQGGSSLSFLITDPNRTRVLNADRQEVIASLTGATVNVSTRGGSPVQLYLSPAAATGTINGPVVFNVLMDTNDQDISEVEGYIQFNPAALRFVSGSVNGAEFERFRGKGRLTLTATSTNTFGYIESAASTLTVQADSMYLYRAYVSATQGIAAARVPSVRLRVNSINLESAFTSEVNSRGDLSLSPNSSGPKALDLLFQPPIQMFDLPIGKRRYTLAFDLLNFFPEDDPRGGVTLNSVEIYRLDNSSTKSVLKNPETVYSTEFSTQEDRAKWLPGPFIDTFAQPEFLQFPSSLAMRVNDKTKTFGFWSADGASLPAGAVTIDPTAPTVIYRATFVLKNEQAADPLTVPDFRTRLASNDFQRSSASVLISVQDGSMVPLPGHPRTLTTFLVLEQVPADFNSFVGAFDILSFYPGRTITDRPLECDSFKIDRVYIPTYPSPR